MAVTFSDPHTEAGLKALDDFLSGKSYISGYQLTKADDKFHAAVLENPSADFYPNANKWYGVVSSKLATRLAVKKQTKNEKQAAKDPNKPKRPLSDFFVFMEDFRKQYKEKTKLFLPLVLFSQRLMMRTTRKAVVAPKSGLPWKNSIDVGARVIDADYKGPVGVILFNHSDVDFDVKPGDRIAQLIIQKIITLEVSEVDDLDSSERGSGGFGSTGV